MTGAVHAGLAAATAACIAANAFIVAADLARARFVMANSAQVGLAPGSIPYLAALKGAGALGLAAGLAGIPFVGLAAAAGLVAFCGRGRRACTCPGVLQHRVSPAVPRPGRGQPGLLCW